MQKCDKIEKMMAASYHSKMEKCKVNLKNDRNRKGTLKRFNR